MRNTPKDQLMLESAYRQILREATQAILNRDELLAKMASYADTQDPETEAAEGEAEALLDWARQHGGEELVQHFIKHGEVAHYGREGRTHGYDPLMRAHSPRVTQAGKLHKQDVSARLAAGPKTSGLQRPHLP